MPASTKYVIYVFCPQQEIIMVSFTAADLQRKAADVQKAAMRSPVYLTYHDKPRFVLLSVEDFAALSGITIKTTPESLPESVVERLQVLADQNEPIELELEGGLADEIR
jgi:PHD/YefM family antitoxin component YafN of YafNO toxin-antitoxin module